MGVTGLWSVLAPVKKHTTLTSLAGKTLAVDLSIWVCETQCVKQMQGVVIKPYLRNLFFRILYLKQIGIHLIFIVDGEAPELKWDVMQKRLQARHPGKFQTKAAGKQGRKNFRSYLKECCQLLDLLGIPYIQSHGEAEAMCAHLNAVGLVNGCLTDDGDAFLYGARTVYRNFTLNSKDPHVESYTMDDIENQLGINQYGLVALALLLGCDYLPNGVPGVGVASARKLLQSLQGFNILSRFQKWRQNSFDFVCIDGNEEYVRKKALLVEGFPQQEVIDEFLEVKEKCPSKIPSWRRPELTPLLEFALCKLEWPPEYTLEKTLPLITLWDMLDIRTKGSGSSQQQNLQPEGIVKTRVRQGVPCFEVSWKMLGCIHAALEAQKLVTIETQELFQKCYPESVKQFHYQQEQKAISKLKGKKKKAHCDPDSHEVPNSDFRKPEESVFGDDNFEVQICTSSQLVRESETSHSLDDPAIRKKRSRKLRSGSTSGFDEEPISMRKDMNKLSPIENNMNTNSKEIFSEDMNLSDLIKRLTLNVEIAGQCQQVITDQSDKNQSDSDDDYLPLSQRLIKRSQSALFTAEKVQNFKPITRTIKMADDRMGVTSDFPRVIPVQGFTRKFSGQNICEIDDDKENLFSQRNESKANTKWLRDFESAKLDSSKNVHSVIQDLNHSIKQGNDHEPEKSDKNICHKSGIQGAKHMESAMLHKVELSHMKPYTIIRCGMSTESVLGNTDSVDECLHKQEQVNKPNTNNELSVTSVTSIQKAIAGICPLVPEEENDSNFNTNCCKISPNCSVDLFTSVDSIVKSPVDLILQNDKINQEYSLLVQPEGEVRTNSCVSHKADNIKRNLDEAEKGSLLGYHKPGLLDSCRALQDLNTDRNKLLNSESTRMERSVMNLNDLSENLDSNKENFQNKVKLGIYKTKWTEGSNICKDNLCENYHEGTEIVPNTVKLQVFKKEFLSLESRCSENNDKVMCRNVCISKVVNQKNPNERCLINCDSSMQFGNFNIETSVLNSPCESVKESDISGFSELESDFHDDEFKDNSSMTSELVKKYDSPDESNFSCRNFDIGAVDNIEKKFIINVDSIVQSSVDEVDESIDTKDMGLAERLRRRMKNSKASQVLDLLSSQI
ncbi:hypothetical protein CHS0354_010376 [Potamilus streckersoni]|uniref:Flap endonuclease GEN homolog 1 n=1 Tax=Potamilus streckersoni TaxID=2493646 RepID=A0AAE0WBI0_9BIVA|nr:hypothetical protein CHS0354_010376 [Potamilus streckersoni]